MQCSREGRHEVGIPRNERHGSPSASSCDMTADHDLGSFRSSPARILSGCGAHDHTEGNHAKSTHPRRLPTCAWRIRSRAGRAMRRRASATQLCHEIQGRTGIWTRWQDSPLTSRLAWPRISSTAHRERRPRAELFLGPVPSFILPETFYSPSSR
jgi:hypothetical protein